MHRILLAMIVALVALPITSAQTGERRQRQVLRSLFDGQPAQPANGAAGYGPVQRTGGLPYGRTYYGGRYFGNFNNRFYGPQYGYF